MSVIGSGLQHKASLGMAFDKNNENKNASETENSP